MRGGIVGLRRGIRKPVIGGPVWLSKSSIKGVLRLLPITFLKRSPTSTSTRSGLFCTGHRCRTPMRAGSSPEVRATHPTRARCRYRVGHVMHIEMQPRAAIHNPLCCSSSLESLERKLRLELAACANYPCGQTNCSSSSGCKE